MSPSRSAYPGVLPTLVGTLGAVILGALAFAPSAHGARADYVGVDACAACHDAAFQVWRESRHARADISLGASPQAKCLACHATGDAPVGRTYFSGVTCEACHGPGKGYAEDDVMRDRPLSLLVGLRDLSTPEQRAALCAECHEDSPRLTPFDPERAYQRIQHASQE